MKRILLIVACLLFGYLDCSAQGISWTRDIRNVQLQEYTPTPTLMKMAEPFVEKVKSLESKPLIHVLFWGGDPRVDFTSLGNSDYPIYDNSVVGFFEYKGYTFFIEFNNGYKPPYFKELCVKVKMKTIAIEFNDLYWPNGGDGTIGFVYSKDSNEYKLESKYDTYDKNNWYNK